MAFYKPEPHEGYVGRKTADGYDKTRSGVKDATSQAVLDEIKRQKDEQRANPNYQGKVSKDVGEFDEAPGGGTPAAGGGRGVMKKNFVVAESPKDPKAIEAKEKGEKVRYMQPRNEDGTFTYNAANAKGLSTKKSRGYTDMPWLAGIDLTFLQKGAVFKTTDPELKRLISTISLTADQLHDAMAIYLEDERGFAGIVGASITKKGREAKAEKEEKYGKVNQVDTSKLSENTQKAITASAENVRKGPFRVGKSTPAAATGSYNPEKTRRGTDRPTATGGTDYSKDVSQEEIEKYTNFLRSQPGLENITEDVVKNLIDSGAIKTEETLSGSGGAGENSGNNDEYKKGMKILGLED